MAHYYLDTNAVVKRYVQEEGDAIHLATAIDLQKQLIVYRIPLTFVCSDRQILRAAAAEGLATENPFDYIHLDR